MPNILAIDCYGRKQHIATQVRDYASMDKPSVNEVIAKNLRRSMSDKKLTQQDLAAKSGVGQTTISLYLNPENRKPSATGKIPSAKVAELEALARSLDLEAWELMVPPESERQRLFREFIKLAGKVSPVHEVVPAQETRERRARVR